MLKLSNTDKKRIMAGIMIITVLVVLLFWTLHAAANICHHCSESECPICALTHQYENAFFKIGGDLASASSLSLIPMLFACAAMLAVNDIKYETPVSRKVRMDN